jgi:hypothetical protein
MILLRTVFGGCGKSRLGRASSNFQFTLAWQISIHVQMSKSCERVEEPSNEPSIKRLENVITELIINNLDSNNSKMQQLCAVQRDCISELNEVKVLLNRVSSGPDMTDTAESVVRSLDNSVRLLGAMSNRVQQMNGTLNDLEKKYPQLFDDNEH